MHHYLTILLSLTAAVLAFPTQDDAALAAAAAAASKKNVYLSTCVERGILDSDTVLAAIYYNKAASSSSSPTDVGTLSSRTRTWEGATRRVTLSAGSLESKIDSGAKDLDKSQIAGTAKLGNEDLVCFVDGTTTFKFDSGLLDLGSTKCTANYWCASIGSGSDD
ncbi:hypothetical protein T440DRAFT_513332 [Plenodomus tracheiphilus IPT5]|uniref:Uncharacterized protein n=1 Tax=Plenodomus tracheiphilus IPT5 TaxID=1408161 RepID=A0A6A7BLE4_9PLEO|nr:hypothetical protein T440DRAFT_513332 [Plenodomus tracheiphilus IPT5]